MLEWLAAFKALKVSPPGNEARRPGRYLDDRRQRGVRYA